MYNLTATIRSSVLTYSKSQLLKQTLSVKPSIRLVSIKTSRSSFDALKLVLVTIPVASFGLGCWQVQRREWKLKLIKELEEKTNSPPVQLPEDLNDLSDLEYRPVKVEGRFLHDKEILLGPRGCLENGDSTPSSGSFASDRNKSKGWLVVTPFKLRNREETILVNRGWVPVNMKSAEDRKEGQIEGNLELVGIIRLTENRPQFMPKNIPSRNQWLYRNLDEMGEYANASPVWIDVKGIDNVPKGWPVPNQTRVTLRNEHLSYIFTWFGLSAATSYMWYIKYFQKTSLRMK